MEPRFIYRNRTNGRFYDASTREMRGGPDKVIVFVDGVLCAMDREAMVSMPVSRWKLAQIGLACLMAALKGKGEAPRPPEFVPLPEPPPETFPETPPKVTGEDSSEVRWERLMRELRDLSR
jgi:hypothetical protein